MSGLRQSRTILKRTALHKRSRNSGPGDDQHGWKYYVATGQTLLTLVLAIFSVLTVLIPVIHDAITPKVSHILFSWQGAMSGGVTIFATNSGERAGTVREEATLNVTYDQKILFSIPLNGGWSEAARVIEPHTSQLLDFGAPGDSGPNKLGQLGLKQMHFDPQKVTCQMVLKVNNWGDSKPATNTIGFECSEANNLFGELNRRIEALRKD